MAKTYSEIEGGICAPQGFLAAGVFCDIKRLGTGKGSDKGAKRDLALIVSEQPCAVAGLFTTNQICAAPVKVCVPRVATGRAQAVVVNSGNANACTGKQGMKDAVAMTDATARALAGASPVAFRIEPEAILVGSTGRIGVNLPMANVRNGIVMAAAELERSSGASDRAVEAIMTSDTRPKVCAVEFLMGGVKVRIGGICKGAGMIQPGMSPDGARPASIAPGLHATMLGFLTTDAAIAPKVLQAALTDAVARSFNCITVDGDMSTNDTVLLLANSMAGNKPVTSKASPGFSQFQEALSQLCLKLAKMMVCDGEGVHRVVTVRVHGARSVKEADAAARAVANSSLVKTSWHGGDPNWGRIIDALGYSSATVVEEKVDIGYSALGSRKVLYSLKRGQPTRATFQQLCAAVAPEEFELHIHLNLGKADAVIYAADLTEEYVTFNKGDVTDPTTLGG